MQGLGEGGINKNDWGGPVERVPSGRPRGWWEMAGRETALPGGRVVEQVSLFYVELHTSNPSPLVILTAAYSIQPYFVTHPFLGEFNRRMLCMANFFAPQKSMT